MQQLKGFKPIFDSASKILILGSFPSVKSRDVGFYYGNLQNRFWKTLCKAFGTSVSTAEEKRQLCLKNNIALWDIVTSCQISGSMDCNIKNYTLANLSSVIEHASIEKILCNGLKAFQLTCKAYSGDIPVIKMPGTSPANVRFDESLWLSELRSIR